MKNRESNLRMLRTEKGMTQQQLADAIGCTLKTIQQYERACAGGVPKSGLDFATVSSLADFFGVSIDYVIGRSDCRSVDNEYIHQKTGLSDASIQNLGNLIQSTYANVTMQEIVHRMTGYIDHSNTYGDAFEMLNVLLSSDHLGDILEGLADYMHTEYQTPVHFEQMDSARGTLPAWKANKMLSPTPCITLARSASTPQHNRNFTITEKWLEGIAVASIETALQEIKKGYKKKGV